MEIQKYNKALVAVIVAALFAALNQVGLTEQSTISDLVNVVVAGVAVYMVPNKK